MMLMFPETGEGEEAFQTENAAEKSAFERVNGLETNSNMQGPGSALPKVANGARGIVAGYGSVDVNAHVFNVININGDIEFFDGQVGNDGSTHFYNFEHFELLLTHPGNP